MTARLTTLEWSRPGVRAFADNGRRAFGHETCFVLSGSGEDRVRALLERGQSLSLVALPTVASKPAADAVRPIWNQLRRTLMVGDAVVKHYRVPAETGPAAPELAQVSATG